MSLQRTVEILFNVPPESNCRSQAKAGKKTFRKKTFRICIPIVRNIQSREVRIV